MSDARSSYSAVSDGQLAEVWGDVVSRPQLAKALAIGAVVSVAVYFIALETIAPMASTPSIGRALAMLAGIVGCLIGGAISARLFPPKRILLDASPGDDAWRNEILEQIELEGGAIGRVEDLPPVVAQEMREIGLYDLFRDYPATRGRNEGDR